MSDVLSVVIPMFNEEALAKEAVFKVGEACAHLVETHVVDDYEIVVVDDGSIDTTPCILDDLASSAKRIRVVHHARNRGLGGSLRTAFAHAVGSLVLYMDADLPFDLAEIGNACALLRRENAGVVSAYRRDRTAEGPRRMIYSFVYNCLIRVVFAIRVRDANFAFKLFRRDALDGLRLRSEGSFIDVELLVGVKRCRYPIAQFEVEFFPRTRGVSTLSSMNVILQIIGELISFRLRRAKSQVRVLASARGAV